YFVWKRPDIDFGWMFWMFAGFILASGTTHLFDVWTLWYADYAVQGVVEAITATISLITAAMLCRLSCGCYNCPLAHNPVMPMSSFRAKFGNAMRLWNNCVRPRNATACW